MCFIFQERRLVHVLTKHCVTLLPADNVTVYKNFTVRFANLMECDENDPNQEWILNTHNYHEIEPII